MDNFIQSLHDLPQDLYDQIAHYVFDYKVGGERVTLGSGYRLPSLLRLNRFSRLYYHQDYYSDTVFLCEHPKYLCQFLRALDWTTASQCWKLIRNMRVIIPMAPGNIDQAQRQDYHRESNPLATGDPVRYREAELRWKLQLLLNQNDTPLGAGIVTFEYKQDNVNGDSQNETALRKWLGLREWSDMVEAYSPHLREHPMLRPEWLYE